MIRPLFAAFACLMATSVAADTTPAPAEVAIIHYDKLSEAKLDGNARDVLFCPQTGAPTDVPCLQLANMRYTPREITVRILGLAAGDYDLYIDTNPDGSRKKSTVFAIEGQPPPEPNYADYFVRTVTMAELEAGITVGLPGTSVSPVERAYYARIQKSATAAARQYESQRTLDDKYCFAGLNGATDWVREFDSGDSEIRSARIIFVPKGKSFSVAGGGFVVPGDPSIGTPPNLADNLHSLRRNVTEKVGDPICRNETLLALTPVDLSLTAEKSKSTAGRYVVRAALRNWTDRLITGKVSLIPPPGWTMKPVLPNVRMRKYASAIPATFTLVAPDSVTAGADTKLSAIVSLNVDGVDMNLLAKVDLAGAK